MDKDLEKPDEVDEIDNGIRQCGKASLFGTTKKDPDTGVLIEAGYTLVPKFEFNPEEMIGRRIKRLFDIVKLVRTMRKPGRKKLRSLYVKDGFMVGYDTITGRTQDGNLIKFTRRGLKHMKERALALGAESVYMFHYCPSEDSVPRGDLVDSGNERILDIKAHIIVYPKSFTFISQRGMRILRVLPDNPVKANTSNKSRRSLLPRASRKKRLPDLSACATALGVKGHYFLNSISEDGTLKERLDDITEVRNYIRQDAYSRSLLSSQFITI